jgi:NADH dehydrogenase FAD-containing subunit
MTTASHKFILAGAGHAHLVAMRQWIDNGFRPPKGTILVNPNTHAWYSGMMPGLIANRFSKAQCAIELAPLCKACGVELMVGEIATLDANKRVIQLANKNLLHYEYLSLNVGSVPPSPLNNDGSIELAPAKPFADFMRYWEAWRECDEDMDVSVLGGGAAAFELALALQKSLPRAYLSIICGSQLLSAYSSGLQKRAINILAKRGIHVVNNARVDGIENGYLTVNDTPVQKADALVVATGAAALTWQRSSGLACDKFGFVEVAANLQSNSHPEVLASGDCARQLGVPHSGVYAVRQGASLTDIIPAWLNSDVLAKYEPQKRALALLATADGNALMSYGAMSGGGRIFGMYKDYIDKSFIRRHRLL